MDLYNIVWSCLINLLIFLLIEGIIYFAFLTSIFDNIIQNVINDLSLKIKNTINYFLFDPSINKTIGFNLTNESTNFQSVAIKIYSIGYFKNSIIDEDNYIKSNKFKSYLLYCLLILSIIIIMIIYYYYNNKQVYNINSFNKSIVLYNVVISLILFIIFILIASLTVFVYIGDNVDINNITLQILNKILILLKK